MKKLYYFSVFIYVTFVLTIEFLSLSYGEDKFYFLTSTSMMPTIRPNSLLFIKRQSAYEVGDVVGYYAKVNEKEEIVAHRIVGIGGNVYLTQGDSNSEPDGVLVLPRLVIGRVVLAVPVMGYLLSIMENLVAKLLLITLPALVIVGIEVKRLIRLARE